MGSIEIRIARAIFESRGYKTKFKDLNAGMKAEYITMAKGAIKEFESIQKMEEYNDTKGSAG